MPKIKSYIYSWDEVPIIVAPYYVAELLKCSVDLIYKDCRKGKLKAFKIGKLWRIRRDSLIAYTKGEVC